MRAIVEISHPSRKGHTMTVRKLKAVPRRLEALVEQDRDSKREAVQQSRKED